MRGMTRREFVRLLAVGTGAAVAAGCSPTEPPKPTQETKGASPATTVSVKPEDAKVAAPKAAAPKAASPKVLTVAQGTEMKSLEPATNIDTARNVFLGMFDQLTTRDNNAKTVGMLAESWKNVNDTTWEFKLRRGVRFHNGQEFTADDVKFTFERIMDPQNKLELLPHLEAYQGVEIVDPYTVRIITKAPYPLVLTRMEVVFILPAKTYKEMGKDAFERKPIGTGPFKFVEWVRDDHLTMERNPEYWRNPVKLDRALWKAIPEPATRIAALATGAVQLCYPVNPEDAPVVERNPDLKLETARGTRQFYVGLNHFEKPLDDVRVRQAIAHAIDVDALIQTVMRGRAYRVPGVAGGPANFGYDASIKPYTFDPELSKRLLTEAGLPNGFEIDFVSTNGRLPNDVEVAQAIGGQLAKVGIRAKVRTLEWGAYQQVFTNKQAKGLHTWSHGNTMFDIDAHLSLNLWSGGRGLYYNTPRTDDLIARARSIVDEKARLTMYSELQRIMQDEVALIPMWEYQNIYGVSKRLKNFVPRVDERLYLHDLDLD